MGLPSNFSLSMQLHACAVLRETLPIWAEITSADRMETTSVHTRITRPPLLSRLGFGIWEHGRVERRLDVEHDDDEVGQRQEHDREVELGEWAGGGE